MAYKTIEQIKVGGNVQGKAWGGFIYAANMQVGYSSSATQLILNIFSPDNNYTIQDTDLKVNTAPTLIKIGDLNINMFLYAYSKNRSPDGGTTLTATYVDQSINLDRVFIGIANEHTRKNIKSVVLLADVPIVCESCTGSTVPRQVTGQVYRTVESYGLNGNVGTLQIGKYGVKQSIFHYSSDSSIIPTLVITVNGTADLMSDNSGSNLSEPVAPTIAGFDLIPSLTTTTIVSYAGYGPKYENVDNPAFSFGSIKTGGFIALGTEEFSQSTCAAGAMTYSLKELKQAIKDFGFFIHAENGLETIPDGYDNLRRNYSGSLRQVLQNWGADYGFDFSYDFVQNKLIGINLRNPILDIESVKDRIKNADSLTNYDGSPVVESLEESASLAGTVRKYHSTVYRKDAKIRTYNKTIYNRATFSPLRLADVMTLPTGYTTYEKFYTSCILATLSFNIWLHYNLITIQSFPNSPVTDKALEQASKKFNIYIDPSIQNFRGLDSKSYKDYISDCFNAQKAIAESFLNQYYVNFYFNPTSQKYCSGGIMDVDYQSSFSDEVETFHKSNGIFPNSLPSYYNIFGKIYSGYLRGVKDLTQLYLGYYSSLSVNSANFLRRSGHYHYSYSLDQLTAANRSLFGFTNLPIDPNNANGDNVGYGNTFEYFFSRADNVSITYSTDKHNPSEVQSIATAYNSSPCLLTCEQDFVSEVCDFSRCLGPGQRIDREWPKGLIPTDNQVKGDTLKISFLGATVSSESFVFEIITPSYAPYQTNFIYSFNSRYLMPGVKKVLAGEVDSDTPGQSDYPQNVEAVDFSTQDITGEIDTYIDNTNNGIVANVMTPENGIMTVENYDSGLRNSGQVAVSVNNLRKTFRFSVPGMLSATFADILTPSKGLLSFDINYDDKGLTTTYNFATRPPKAPARDVVFTRISPNFVKR